MMIQRDYDAWTGGPRPTDFTSAPGSGPTVQYWRLISKTPGD